MVRTNINDEAEDKKESTKKKAAGKNAKKPSSSGLWPCKINGCNKQFAREADLKRHQRTTKLHSMPGFACPQCDATFTRTDALRRHQKSRHNGVVDALDQVKEEEPAGPSSSRSSSTTPSSSSKGKERETSTVPMTEPIPGSNASLAAPVTSYYRQHTANNTYPPRPAHYAQVSLPTSASRSDPSNWSHSNWPDGQGPPPPGPLHYMYIATPYYRTANAVNTAPPLLTPVSQAGPSAFSTSIAKSDDKSDDGKVVDSPSTTSSRSPSMEVDRPLSPAPLPPTSATSTSGPLPSPSAESDLPTSSRDQHERSSSNTQFHQFLSEAGMEAMKNMLSDEDADGEADEDCEEDDMAGHEVVQPNGGAVAAVDIWRRNADLTTQAERGFEHIHNDGDNEDGRRSDDMDHERQGDLSSRGYIPQLERPAPMEHMLTEDGEPMLNPAELLTQEHLES